MKVKDIRSGDIYWFFNAKARKTKIHVCVGDNLFFWINTERHSGNIEVLKTDYPNALDADSWLNCRHVVDANPQQLIEDETRHDRLTRKTLECLNEAVTANTTIPEDTRQGILIQLFILLKTPR